MPAYAHTRSRVHAIMPVTTSAAVRAMMPARLSVSTWAAIIMTRPPVKSRSVARRNDVRRREAGRSGLMRVATHASMRGMVNSSTMEVMVA